MHAGGGLWGAWAVGLVLLAGAGAAAASPAGATSEAQQCMGIEWVRINGGTAEAGAEAGAGATGLRSQDPASPSSGVAASLGIEWVRIEGGVFSIGVDEGHFYYGPRRQVAVPTFLLAKTEVTVAQYRACVERGPCTAPDTCQRHAPNWGRSGRDNHPINCVDWEQASTFARWAGGRLPSAAEWEYAARSGGRDQRYPWGDAEASCATAVMWDNGKDGCGRNRTGPVCSKPGGHSAQGVCDLAGNVEEWVADWAGPFSESPSDGSARSRASEYRVTRGGSWADNAGALEVAERSSHLPIDRNTFLGFRIAAVTPAAEARRLLEEAQATLRSHVARDFAAIRRLVEQPDDAGRPALRAFAKKYGAASVSIDGVSHPLLPVPEVALVERAWASGGSCGGVAGEGPVGIEWVRIEGGSFQMGSQKPEERPRRLVAVPGFELMRTEVTVAQYRACVEARRCRVPDAHGDCNWGKPGRDDHPINCVDWGQALAFAKWAGARLPSEAEWEYAARSGGREQEYPWGDREADTGIAVMQPASGSAPVCSISRGNSDKDVCDLAGNVWEWVEDWQGPYTQASSDGSARSSGAEYRVFRGGSWRNDALLLRARYRGGLTPGYSGDHLGFRLAR